MRRVAAAWKRAAHDKRHALLMTQTTLMVHLGLINPMKPNVDRVGDAVHDVDQYYEDAETE